MMFCLLYYVETVYLSAIRISIVVSCPNHVPFAFLLTGFLRIDFAYKL